MKVNRSRKLLLSLESVAMTDIVMNLFIFFFISFSLLYTFNPNKESKIEIKLPEGTVQESVAAENGPLVVTITSGNEIYVEKNRFSLPSIRKEFAKRSEGIRRAGILVRSDKDASVDTLIQVLDAAKSNGISKLGVAIEKAR